MTNKTISIAVALVLVGLIGFWLGMFIRLRRIGVPAVPSGPRLIMQFADVGDGDAGLVYSPGGLRLLIDCGPDQAGALEVISQTRRVDAPMPDVMILTSARARSIGGAPYVLNHTSFHGVIVLPCSDVRFERMGGDAAKEVVQAAVKRGVVLETWDKFESSDAGRLQIDPNATVALLPIDETSPKHGVGDAALAVRVDYGANSELYVAGLTAGEESMLVANRSHLACDVLAATDGGAENSLSAEFLANAAPRVIVFSNAASDPPDEDVLARAAASAATVERTDTLGTITLGLDQQIGSPISYYGPHTQLPPLAETQHPAKR